MILYGFSFIFSGKLFFFVFVGQVYVMENVLHVVKVFERVHEFIEFDKVFAAYNELQKGEGLDLARYKGKKVMRYTYKITNYEGYSDPVYANLLIYKNKVVGGDVCSADPNGFAHGLSKA